MPHLVPTLMILVRVNVSWMKKNEKISQKSIKREIEMGGKNVNVKSTVGSFVFNFECKFIIQRLREIHESIRQCNRENIFLHIFSPRK